MAGNPEPVDDILYWVCRMCGEMFEAADDVIPIIKMHVDAEVAVGGMALDEHPHEGFYLQTETEIWG